MIVPLPGFALFLKVIFSSPSEIKKSTTAQQAARVVDFI